MHHNIKIKSDGLIRYFLGQQSHPKSCMLSACNKVFVLKQENLERFDWMLLLDFTKRLENDLESQNRRAHFIGEK